MRIHAHDSQGCWSCKVHRPNTCTWQLNLRTIKRSAPKQAYSCTSMVADFAKLRKGGGRERERGGEREGEGEREREGEVERDRERERAWERERESTRVKKPTCMFYVVGYLNNYNLVTWQSKSDPYFQVLHPGQQPAFQRYIHARSGAAKLTGSHTWT